MNRAQRPNASSNSNRLMRAPSRPWLGALIALSATSASMAMLGVACSPSGDDNGFTESGSSTGNSGNSSSGNNGSGGSDIFGDAGPKNAVDISPKNPIIKLELPAAGQEIQFTCTDTGTGNPTDATFSLNTLEIGSITPTGLFKPNGIRAGEATVRCEYMGGQAETTVRVIIHAVDNMGGLSQQQIDVLKGPPGLSDPSWQFIYPYDKTVFPRGILAPEIHLASGSFPGNGFFVEIVGNNVHYEGFFNTGANNTQIQMSQSAWTAVSNSAPGETLEVRISKLYNNQKYGPIFRRWIIASGALHGVVYYNTYDSPLAQQTGAMMRIKGNSPTPEVLIGNCTVCHSVSADGSTAAAANHGGPGGIFDLTGGFLNPPLVWTDSERTAFAGLYPKNGEVFVVNGAPGFSWPPNTPGTSNTWNSELRTKNGTIIPNSGIESYFAQSPVFSHDGTMLAFTDRQGTSPYSSVLAMMKYDSVAQKFSGYEVLATPKSGLHDSWPAFTPDGQWVVYQEGLGDDLATWSGNTGRLFAVNTQTKQVVYLGNANGDGYMPQGARDENKNYEPTISPVASGGYFWMMFTSRRTYGNKLTGSEYETKRLWVSALSINANGVDFSHPAFYVSGQELTSGNSRGFWAQDACKQDGDKCEFGDECCTGSCNPGPNGEFVCGPPQGCSNEFGICTTSADCCNSADQCINGKCAFVPPN